MRTVLLFFLRLPFFFAFTTVAVATGFAALFAMGMSPQ
jgi:hypothetical protein